MITVSMQTIYYTFSIIAILCSTAFKIGYKIGKNAKK